MRGRKKMRLGWWSGGLPVPTIIVAVVFLSVLPPVSGEGVVQDAPAKGSTVQTDQSAVSKVVFDPERFSEAYDSVARTSHRTSQGIQAELPTGEESAGLTRILAQVVFSLALVIGGIYFGTYLLNRFMGKSLLHTSGPLKVLAKRPLSQKNSLYVVSALGRFLIIGESPQGLTCLAEFKDPEENRILQETWGWDWGAPAEKNRLFTEKNSPFGPTLQSHVTELERELDRIKEVS